MTQDKRAIEAAREARGVAVFVARSLSGATLARLTIQAHHPSPSAASRRALWLLAIRGGATPTEAAGAIFGEAFAANLASRYALRLVRQGATLAFVHCHRRHIVSRAAHARAIDACAQWLDPAHAEVVEMGDGLSLIYDTSELGEMDPTTCYLPPSGHPGIDLDRPTTPTYGETP
jgi:hypothetical protein